MTVLAIDIGSSSTRAGVYNDNLSLLSGSFCQESYELMTGPDGRATLDPESLFTTVCNSIDHAVKSGHPVDRVGISCFWHSLMGVDEDGGPTTELLTWAETRAHRSVAVLRDEQRFSHHQRTGTPVHASYPIVKLRWLREQEPALWDRTSRWISFPEYLQFRLHGAFRVSLSMASGTGLLNRTALAWDDTACTAAGGVGIDQLSSISDEPFQGLLDDYAHRWPELRDARWYPAIGDGAANNLGAGATAAARPALMVGTTGALRVITTAPPAELSTGLWQYRLDADRAIIGGALSEGGSLLSWAFQNLQLPDDEALHRRITEAGPDSHGLTVLPWFAGERSPDWEAESTGAIHGLRLHTDAVQIVQALMESVAYSFATILDSLEPLLAQPVEIIATGNGLRKNRAWIQIIADTLGYPLLLPGRKEASLRGAAIFALQQDLPEFTAPLLAADVERFQPDSARYPVHRRAMARRQAYSRLGKRPLA